MVPPVSSSAPPAELQTLIAEFGSSSSVMAPSYREDWVRTEYIEPLFVALGWSRLNPAKLTTASTGFVRELPLAAPDTAPSQTPDYGFYVDGQRRFFVEAKKPYINIALDSKPALQIRNYGWSATDDIGIVTDFEEFAVYNCRVKPIEDDKPEVGLIEYMRFDRYESRWPWLVEHLSPDAVREDAPVGLVQAYKDKKRLIPVGPAFLDDIERWRLQLAKAIHRDNSVSSQELTEQVQTLLDRLVFLRIAEARGLESRGSLRSLLSEQAIYPALFKLFELADIRYNSGLFHFRLEEGRGEPDLVSRGLVVDDKALTPIIDDLTSEGTPYRFEVIPTDILGNIYERFLGKELRVKGSSVAIEHKPEFQKSGGVFYTPTWIVEYIVDRALQPILEGKSVNQARELRIVDPACGSGSFLISAYQYLIDWYTEKYMAYKRSSDRSRFLMQGVDGRPRLRIEERRRILLENIYGVDIDRQAVEVAKLSLLLKVIEGETQTALQLDRLLPDLDRNIICGNSLVGTDFYSTTQLIDLTPDEAAKVNAFDWSTAFPSIAERHGFDAVVGNPPWLMAGYYVADSMAYFHRNYQSAKGKTDLYYLFIEKALRLVKPDGRIGMIVPSKLFHTRAARALRGLLAEGGWLEEIVDFGTAKLFPGATNYSCVLSLSKGNVAPVRVKRRHLDFEVGAEFSIPREEFGSSPWHLIEPNRRELWARLSSEYEPLERYASGFGNGVQSGADRILILDDSERASRGIEAEACVGVLRGRNVRRFTASPDRVLVFPYVQTETGFELMPEDDLRERFPGAYAYLDANRKALNQRRWFGKSAQELAGGWYGLMFLDEARSFAGEKIVTPSLAPSSNFALSRGHLFVTGTAGVTSVRLREDNAVVRRFLLGLLNSRLLSECIVDHSTPYQGRYFKFSAPYIRGVPIAMPDLTLRKGRQQIEEIALLVDALEDHHSGVNGERLQNRLDELVFDLYRVTRDERAALES